MDDKQNFSRETAKLCSLKELINGEYTIQEGWQPNYVLVGERKISRINIIGVVVEKSSQFQFVMDDGTASILVMDFNKNQNTSKLQVGDPVLVIGRPRMTDNGLFIASEIVSSDQLKKNKEWLLLRKKQLNELPKSDPKTEQAVVDSPKHFVEAKLPSQQVTGDDVVDFIKKKDTGDGVLIEESIAFFGEDADEIILMLLSMGEIYEIKPGRVKVLE